MKFAEEEAGLFPETRAVNDFIQSLLCLFGFTNKNQKVRQCPSMYFMMLGKRVNASTDVTLSLENPETQLITETIATFYENCERHRCVGRPALTEQVMFGITMARTAPIFYCIPVTKKLLGALEHRPYPEEETVILRFMPPIPNMNSYLTSGMQPLENHHIVFQYFKGLKALIVHHITYPTDSS
ncbi:hypothetical protein AN958_10598 [Leucoagaricus sp. SymC.cos]|nr:hypothetical protein AN958_10598 [Leucoagaricus sp. SymC.cos]